MSRPIKDLFGRDQLTPERRARIDAKKSEMLEEMRLDELRKARKLSQVTLAETLGVPQSAISKIEHRTDVYVSTLRHYLEAMGAELHIVAAFPNGENVEICQFEEIGDPVCA